MENILLAVISALIALAIPFMEHFIVIPMKERADRGKSTPKIVEQVEYVSGEDGAKRVANTRSAPWLVICFKAFITPDLQYYSEILRVRPLSTIPVFTFLFVSGVFIMLSDSLYQVVVNIMDKTPLPFLEVFLRFTFSPIFGSLLFILTFVMFVGMVQLTARVLGSTGSFNTSFSALAIVTLPYSILYSILTVVSAIPFLEVPSLIVSGLVGIYYIVLLAIMLKAANHFGWWRTIGSIVIPFFILSVISICLFIVSEITLQFLEDLGIGV